MIVKLVNVDDNMARSVVCASPLKNGAFAQIKGLANEAKAGVALNPATPLCMIEHVLCDVDLVLLMSVNPGFGGQSFIESAIGKVQRLREMIDAQGSKALIEVDGGVQAETAPRLVAAGVDVLVSGSYIFKAADPIATIKALKAL